VTKHLDFLFFSVGSLAVRSLTAGFFEIIQLASTASWNSFRALKNPLDDQGKVSTGLASCHEPMLGVITRTS